MPNAADSRISVSFGKHKRTSKNDRAKRTAAARLVRTTKYSTSHSNPAPSDEELSDPDDDKENDAVDRPTPSDPLKKQKKRARTLKSEVDKFRKKAKYWQEKAQQSKERERRLDNAPIERENDLREVIKKQYTEIQEKNGKIEGLEQEVERQRIMEENTKKSVQIRLEEYQRQIHALKAKTSRIPGRLTTAAKRIARTYNNKADEERTFFLKNSDGVIPDEARDVFLDLVSMDAVPANKVTRVFKRIAGVFGIEVEGNVSRRSVGRITKEGGNASKLQLINSLKDAKGITLSGDGMTHKNETYESKFATIITPDKKLQFFLGLKMAVNHTSETQLAGWIETTEELFHLAYQSGLILEDDARVFWNLVTGFHSDHAADQKKLFELLKKWKEQLEREVRGEQAIKQLTDNEYACLIFQGSQVLVQKVGGPAAWDTLSTKELIRDIGEAEFEKLSEGEKAEVDLILWAGCCMHKEMNAFKGGCIGLDEYWNENPHLPPPILLPNRDNAAAIKQAAGTEAAKRATARSERGAIKVASLAGAIFRHKDRKWGQQDTLRFYFDQKLGFNLAFPDTSNTRFQSHAEACALIITHMDLFIEFLTYVQHNKGSGKLNHMEKNVLDGLNDPATRQEFCVITLYWLAISVPYMREIRGPQAKEDNVLKLGSLHQQVIDHIDVLIEEPERLLGPDASATRGSLDGHCWERPDAFYAAQKHASQQLPQVRGLLVHFLKKAKESWLRFMSEFEEGGALSRATPEQIERAWMEKTNDLNEGAFGSYRQTSRMNPTMSLDQYNARQMYKFNQTSAYLHTLSPEMRQWLRKITRTQDESGANRQERIHMAQHRQEVADKRITKDLERREKRQAAAKAVDAITPILALTELDYRVSRAQGTAGYFPVPEITLQLKWHKQHGVKDAVPQTESAWGKREEKMRLLRSAIEKYADANASRCMGEPVEGRLSNEEEILDVTVEELDGFDSECYDSEEDYYT
ncbi:hypothetical protein C8R41DRAFT_928430 [Lentinula lateritia]|uniref:Uncharacterized protein n=1 Tax=Lentinula lateritia TaxID=40482 RepID=A0ABQ8VZA3_9AGAR|nr:hypothetical protein C8R41DRAFT_928430 [Lentinula lateritia]